jgi:predicted flap endonuclease-1-like 5' DNA nuclease
MASLIRTLNAFLPFTNPSTPILQDVIHTIVLCTFLWFAPQIEWKDLRGRVLGRKVEQNEAEQLDGALGEEVEGAEVMEEQAEAEQFGQEDRAGDAIPDEAAFAPPPDFENADEAGPVNPTRRNANSTREVGAKKAKSLAKRNQQRAYNEFLREQGEAERAEWARDSKEREEKLEQQRAERAAREQVIKDKERKEREGRKIREGEERREELDAVRDAGEILREGLVEDGFVRCEDLARRVNRDVEWVEKLVRREGVLGVRDVDGKREVTLLTKRGFVVRISEDMMRVAYERAAVKGAKGDGRVSWEDLGGVIQKVVTERVS